MCPKAAELRRENSLAVVSLLLFHCPFLTAGIATLGIPMYDCLV